MDLCCSQGLEAQLEPEKRSSALKLHSVVFMIVWSELEINLAEKLFEVCLCVKRWAEVDLMILPAVMGRYYSVNFMHYV